ncbi:MAG: hypothetical protein Q4F00_03365 [bacterium]|nr:hypothetical protein [bacterium]
MVTGELKNRIDSLWEIFKIPKPLLLDKIVTFLVAKEMRIVLSACKYAPSN